MSVVNGDVPRAPQTFEHDDDRAERIIAILRATQARGDVPFDGGYGYGTFTDGMFAAVDNRQYGTFTHDDVPGEPPIAPNPPSEYVTLP
jgi:hypothetical protein